MILDYQGDKRPVVIDSAASYVILPRVDHGIFGRDIRRGVKTYPDDALVLDMTCCAESAFE